MTQRPSSPTVSYADLVLRNAVYVPEEVQRRIRETSVLIAGCGVGSSIAESAIRVGFEHITLVDGDRVEAHNLNRQQFEAVDVGTPKVTALARRLLAINPSASVTALNTWVTDANAGPLVSQADLVFDTIDFLSLEAVVALHDACHRKKKPVISAMNVGWGAAAMYFPPDGRCTFREMVGLPRAGSVKGCSYVKHFGAFVERLRDHLDPEIIPILQQALTVMEDGTPCPAPSVSPGVLAVGSLTITMAIRLLRGAPVTAAPRLILANLAADCVSQRIDLAAPLPS